VSVELLWTLPVAGDARWYHGHPSRRGGFGTAARFSSTVTDHRPGRFTSFDYLVQVARAAELSGWDGLVIPDDAQGEESWIVASSLAREVPQLRLVTELRPGFGTAVYAAKLALSFQRFFDDRLAWKVSMRADASTARSLGDFVDHDGSVQRAEELLVLARGIWHESPFDFDGQFFQVQGGGFFDPTPNAAVLGGQGIARRPFPGVLLDGTTDAELELSARHADVHVFDEARPAALAALIGDHRSRAARLGREVRYGVRLAVIARDEAYEAWLRLARAIGGDAPLEADGVLWHGFGELGARAVSGVVGSFDEVAVQFGRYLDLGVTTFVLDSAPHLEEAYRLGEYLLPLIRARGESSALSRPDFDDSQKELT
jgi:alkanesulfonate monooxygenase